jgi:hypothetical protein
MAGTGVQPIEVVDPQRRRLPGAVRSEEGNIASFADSEADVLDSRHLA